MRSERFANEREIERALKEAKNKEVNLIAPQIGETVAFDSDLNNPHSSWWDN